MIALSACSDSLMEDGRIEVDEALPNFESYSIDDLNISVPANWAMTKEETPGGDRVEFRDHEIESIPWHDVDVYTNLSIFVAREEWVLQNTTAQEYIDQQREALIPEAQADTALIEVNGVEAGKITSDRPYFSYRIIEVFIPYGGKEYYINMHYDSGDKDMKEKASEIINSIDIVNIS